MAERTELSQMSGAAGTIVLGGQTYLLRQLRLGDYGQVQEWLRERLPRPFQVVAQALKDLEPLRAADADAYERSRKELMLAAMEDSKAQDVGGDPAAVESALNSPDGVAFIIWLCIRANHPGVTYEKIRDCIHEEDMVSLKAKMDEVTVLASGDDDGEEHWAAEPKKRPLMGRRERRALAKKK